MDNITNNNTNTCRKIMDFIVVEEREEEILKIFAKELQAKSECLKNEKD